ncbi:hypothetical protein [Streptomyces sp. NP-1717]|uniref:hypothetical protein n=1 Tax=Streptomyces sp. NP-1717 TaxID=2704470 RepID=UPI001F5C79E8|nr:hypothetical protein [Streptomyces sp. NP-1717]MCI3226764.1 hypothetical protein [Streptomyces sp. NP-1717]
MLTYREVMTTDFGKLSSAADMWKSMAEEFGKVEKRYRDGVQKITLGDVWQGESADAASLNFAATRYEYQAAQTQAKATSTLLRNAHDQFVELKKRLETARADAIKAGMRVSEQGNVAFDYERATESERDALRHDPDYAKSVRDSEQSWAESVKACVKAVDDADKDFQKDLEAVAKDSGGGKNDGTAGGFNGNADGVAKADDQQKRERMELASLGMRDNETIDDYIARLQKEAVEKGTGSKRLAELFAAVQNGTVTAGAFVAAGVGTAGTAWKLFSYLKSGKDITAAGTTLANFVNPRIAGAAPGSLLSKVPPGLVGALTGSDEAAQFGTYLRNGSWIVPTATEANLVRVAQTGGLANAASAAGWLRGAGVVGGVAATAYGVANLATYDADMIKADPSKFATDLTGTAFNASMTALTVAPNPVTAGLAIGTGVLYAGALVWDNHEAIGKGLDTAGDWVGDKASDIGDGIADGAKKLGGALNPFD